ncbi:hypothetical protein [Knoellia sp. Soil729]|uniref:hypothetical protein n=1 Tax=Knoellia sp. Soil729 TaxID=1736394 RepID=UPI0012E7AAAC|nr:hypothetical protein [Knoellia sp. Soil729]
MQPSSLIFLVIIGIWAAYFVQYWVRRREHLATIRSVDAFSQTMRVLERRAPLLTVDSGGQAPRTSALSPARAMRPQVTVKRAAAHVAAPAPRVEVPASAERAAPTAAVAAPAGMHPSRATRGTVLLVGLLGTIAFGALSALSVLVWWSFVVPFVMAGVGFFWLRAGIQAEARARRAARGRARRAAARTGAPAPTFAARPSAQSASVPTAASEPVGLDDIAVTATVDAEAATEQVAPYDVSAHTESRTSTPLGEERVAEHPLDPAPVVAEHEVALPELDEDDIPLTWDPRPVPRPTYTMKARAAERPAPAPRPQPTAQAEHPAYEDVPERRIAGL